MRPLSATVHGQRLRNQEAVVNSALGIARIITAVIATSGIVAAAAFAQAQAPTEFEVASVRPNLANDRIVTIRVGPGGTFSARGYTLVLLIQRAYGVMDWNVSGGPAWIRTDRYDVAAKANVQGDITEAELQPMLAKLLSDRFKLKLHHSSTQTSGYGIQVANGGPKLKPTADGQEHRDTFRLTNVGLSGQGISMRDFARFFGGKLGLISVDETGLTGPFDFKVDWKIDSDRPADLPGADSREPLREAAFDALQTQLGLKAVQKKVTVETLVIESVEKASASDN
jgi:uncharacterized protein (TIGR03435 family)